jgi:Co/Zn/Cd efflux system component
MIFPEIPLYPWSKANLLPQSVQCVAWLFITVSLTAEATQRLLHEEVISKGEEVKISIQPLAAYFISLFRHLPEETEET